MVCCINTLGHPSDYLFLGETAARQLLEAIPMTEDLHAEFSIFDKAISVRDKKIHAKWNTQYTAWVSGDHSGTCPFETKDNLKRKYTRACTRHQY
jgi:hypothetical protein